MADIPTDDAWLRLFWVLRSVAQVQCIPINVIGREEIPLMARSHASMGGTRFLDPLESGTLPEDWRTGVDLREVPVFTRDSWSFCEQKMLPWVINPEVDIVAILAIWECVAGRWIATVHA
jgi:hypothetical protein